MDKIRLRDMVASDFPAARSLWEGTKGVGLNESDTQEAIEIYLRRNPGMSAVAIRDEVEIVGTVLCGHDGRRGYLHHLAVAEAHRRKGIGNSLIARAFERLKSASIAKCNIFLYSDNEMGRRFWESLGWKSRADLAILQKDVV